MGYKRVVALVALCAWAYAAPASFMRCVREAVAIVGAAFDYGAEWGVTTRAFRQDTVLPAVEPLAAAVGAVFAHPLLAPAVAGLFGVTFFAIGLILASGEKPPGAPRPAPPVPPPPGPSAPAVAARVATAAMAAVLVSVAALIGAHRAFVRATPRHVAVCIVWGGVLGASGLVLRAAWGAVRPFFAFALHDGVNGA